MDILKNLFKTTAAAMVLILFAACNFELKSDGSKPSSQKEEVPTEEPANKELAATYVNKDAAMLGVEMKIDFYTDGTWLAYDDVMDEEDAALYKEIDAWFAEILPFPEPCMNKERVVCFFKTENTEEMMRLIRPALWLLERYNHPFYVVYTNDPGEIVYEDQYQVAVKVEDPIIEVYEHTWVGKE